MAFDAGCWNYASLLDEVLLDGRSADDQAIGELYTEFLPADKAVEPYLKGLADSIPVGESTVTVAAPAPRRRGTSRARRAAKSRLGQAELQGTSSGAAETGHISPPQTPPAGSVPNASGTPVGSNPTTSSDDMHDKSAGSSKRKRFRTKDEKNVALNKLSQLRYREKKKAKTVAMQQSAEVLSKEAADIQALRIQNMVLQDKNSWLQTSLEQVERRLDAARAAAAGGSGAGPDGMGTATAAQHAGRDANGAGSPPSDEGLFEGLQTQFEAKYAMLAAFLAKHSFAPPAQHGADAEAAMPAAAINECRAIVAGVMAACRRLTIAEGADAQELLNADFQQWFDLAGNWDDPAKIIAAVKALQLSKQQRSKLLQLRELWTEDIRRLYMERQSLNLELIGVMLPAAIDVPGSTEQLPPTLQAQDNDEQQVVLLMDRLEGNLRTELRNWSQYDYEILTRILSPVQGAIYISRTYPEHCDPFALVNAVHEIGQGTM